MSSLKRGLGEEEFKRDDNEIVSITALLERVLAQASLGHAQTNLDQADHLIELNDLEQFKVLLAQNLVLTEDEKIHTKVEKLPPWLVQFSRLVGDIGPTDRVNYPALNRLLV